MKLPSPNQGFEKRQLLPAGSYRAVITIAEMRKSQKGNDYLYLKLQVCEGAFHGEPVWCNITFKSKQHWLARKGRTQWIELLNALQWTKCEDEAHLLGKEVLITTVNKDRSGSTFTEVKSFNMPKSAMEIVEEAKESGDEGSASSW